MNRALEGHFAQIDTELDRLAHANQRAQQDAQQRAATVKAKVARTRTKSRVRAATAHAKWSDSVTRIRAEHRLLAELREKLGLGRSTQRGVRSIAGLNPQKVRRLAYLLARLGERIGSASQVGDLVMDGQRLEEEWAQALHWALHEEQQALSVAQREQIGAILELAAFIETSPLTLRLAGRLTAPRIALQYASRPLTETELSTLGMSAEEVEQDRELQHAAGDERQGLENRRLARAQEGAGCLLPPDVEAAIRAEMASMRQMALEAPGSEQAAHQLEARVSGSHSIVGSAVARGKAAMGVRPAPSGLVALEAVMDTANDEIERVEDEVQEREEEQRGGESRGGPKNSGRK